jgi:hypothetical protein
VFIRGRDLSLLCTRAGEVEREGASERLLSLSRHRWTRRRRHLLDVLDELRVEEGEAHELGLVQVHHEQLVCRGQICLLASELLVEVAHVLAMFLQNGNLGQISSIGSVYLSWILF